MIKNLGIYRINRNILECKEKKGKTYISTLLSINRNILECKDALNKMNENFFMY